MKLIIGMNNSIMFLITSAAYVSGDLVSEIGKLPPSMLPVGNKRLFLLQLEQLTAKEDVYISIPEDYSIEPHDLILFERAGVQVIYVPKDMSLGESVLYCWNSTGKQHSTLRILHGDTLIRGIDFSELDAVSIAQNQGYYHRATVSRGNLVNGSIEDAWAGDDEWVLSGYFSFSNPQLFIQGIVRSSSDFVGGLKHYSKNHQLKGVEGGEWFDFGHINTFFRSRTMITTQRAFNEMRITPRLVIKASFKRIKMQAEANWFNSLPSHLRMYTPHLLSDKTHEENASYSLEYLYLLPLNDMFVYGNLPGNVWQNIFQACKETHDAFSQHKPDVLTAPDKLDSIYLPKTLSRLNEFSQKQGFDIAKPLVYNSVKQPSLLDIAHQTSQLISKIIPDEEGIVHGDFCFSNILYDARVQSIKVIDPRGLDNEGDLSIYGDTRYDVAKLYHSVIGLYDLIIANRFQLDVDVENGSFTLHFTGQERIAEIQKTFRNTFFSGNSESERIILAITIHLFLSMLPLHSDRPEGQLAMIANVLRLNLMLTDYDVVRFEDGK